MNAQVAFYGTGLHMHDHIVRHLHLMHLQGGLGHHQGMVWLFRLVLLAALFLVACSSDDSKSTSSGSATQSAFSAMALEKDSVPLRFVDSVSGQLIGETLNVKFTGAAKVKNTSGQLLNEQNMQVTAGKLTVMPDYSAGESFTVLVGNRVTGYVETGVVVSKGGRFSESAPLDIPLIKLSDPSIAATNAADLGIAVAKRVSAVGSDQGIPALTLSTPPKTITSDFQADANGPAKPRREMGSASIEIAEGTRVVDARGLVQTITGPVTVSAVYYSGLQEQSLARFPGGFRTRVEGALPTGSPANGQGIFITGGFASFNITDARGQALKLFDRPLKMSIDLPRQTANPATKQFYKAGDTFPVWSFEETTGKWSFEANGVVSEKTPANPELLEVRYEARHLTSWNLDHLIEECSVKLRVPIHRDDVTLTAFGFASAPFYMPDVNIRAATQGADTRVIDLFLPKLYSQQYQIFDVDNNQSTLISAITRLRVDVRHRNTQALLGFFYHDGTCDVTIPPPPVPVRDYTVNVTEGCVSPARMGFGPDTHVRFSGRLAGYSGPATTLGETSSQLAWRNTGPNTKEWSISYQLPSSAEISNILVREYLPNSGGAPGSGYAVRQSVDIPTAQQATQTTFNVSYSLQPNCPGVTDPPGGGGGGGNPIPPPSMSQ